MLSPSFSPASLASPEVQRSPPASPARDWSQGAFAGALNVLVVEDDAPVRAACAGMAESFGCRVRTAPTVAAAREILAAATFDVVFLDVRLPGGSGDVLLRELRHEQPHTFVVMMTAFATVTSAVELMRSGAGEFLQKPFALTQITDVLATVSQRRGGARESRVLQERLKAGLAGSRLIGTSAEMQKLFRMVAKVAPTRHPVLIVGERGTGKENVARTIHANGPHPNAPFVPIDCDSLRPQQLEAELFGVPRPGETAPALGVLARAGEGTVYLSEIAYLDPQAQARLTRAISERQIRPSPVEAAVPFHARLLASTSRDLAQLVDSGRFRKDLFYRLNVVTLRVPALRERVEDIPLLTEVFLEQQRKLHGIPFVLSEQALTSLLRYHWGGGNVQELESLVERACGLSTEASLHFGDMSTQVKTFVQTVAEPPPAPEVSQPEPVPLLSIQELEKRAIQDALRQLNGDKNLVARCLGIGKTTLYRKLKEYNLLDEGSPGQ